MFVCGVFDFVYCVVGCLGLDVVDVYWCVIGVEWFG